MNVNCHEEFCGNYLVLREFLIIYISEELDTVSSELWDPCTEENAEHFK